MKRFLSLLLSVLLLGCAQATPPDTAQHARITPANAASTVNKALAGSGIEISGELDAPSDYFGFIGNYQGRQIPVYLMPDGKHIAIGTLLDTQGHDLTSPAMRKAVDSRYGPAEWDKLEKAAWIVEGNPKGKHIVYVFVDTRCPFCHKFWEMSQPFLDDSNVQIRNILVAVIAPASLPEGALVLDAADPTMAFQKAERNFGHQPKPKPDAGSAASRAKIMANSALMQELGFYGTPSMLYKDAEGKIRVLSGVPQDAKTLDTMFGK